MDKGNLIANAWATTYQVQEAALIPYYEALQKIFEAQPEDFVAGSETEVWAGEIKQLKGMKARFYLTPNEGLLFLHLQIDGKPEAAPFMIAHYAPLFQNWVLALGSTPNQFITWRNEIIRKEFYHG